MILRQMVFIKSKLCWCLASILLHRQLFETCVETLLNTMFRFDESPPGRSDQRVQNVTNCWQRSQKLNLEWPIDQNVTGWPKCRQRVPRGAKLGSEGIKATKIGTAGTRGDKNWDQGWPREQKKEQLVRVDQVYQLLPGGTKLGSRVSKVSKIWPIVDSLVKSWIKVDQAHQNGTNCWQGGRNWYQGWPGYQSES
jgi:hypothetical protein